jgi:hypothetical protein
MVGSGVHILHHYFDIFGPNVAHILSQHVIIRNNKDFCVDCFVNSYTRGTGI